MSAINEAPGKLMLGKIDTKKKLQTKSGKQALTARIKKQIEQKFSRKWGYT